MCSLTLAAQIIAINSIQYDYIYACLSPSPTLLGMGSSLFQVNWRGADLLLYNGQNCHLQGSVSLSSFALKKKGTQSHQHHFLKQAGHNTLELWASSSQRSIRSKPKFVCPSDLANILFCLLYN